MVALTQMRPRIHIRYFNFFLYVLLASFVKNHLTNQSVDPAKQIHLLEENKREDMAPMTRPLVVISIVLCLVTSVGEKSGKPMNMIPINAPH